MCRTPPTFAGAGAFEVYLSDDILEETAGVLLTRSRLRRRYQYADANAVDVNPCRPAGSIRPGASARHGDRGHRVGSRGGREGSANQRT